LDFGFSILDFGLLRAGTDFGFSILDFRLFRRIVISDATVMATISFNSLIPTRRASEGDQKCRELLAATLARASG
jgi:hypothetical protein